MGMLNNMCIRTKVVMSFGLVLMMTLGLGGFAQWRLSDVNDVAIEMRETRLPSARILGEIAVQTERHRSQLVDLMLIADGSQDAAINTLLAEIEAKRDKDWKAYEALVSQGEERKLADAIHRTWSAYLANATTLRRLESVRELPQ